MPFSGPVGAAFFYPNSKLMKRLFILGALAALPVCGQSNKSEVLAQIDANKATYEQIALKIWDFAEIGYREVKSSGLLQEQLKKEGFTIEAGVAGMPTAFVATFGSGHPIIGILGEFDALPGVSQQAIPEKKNARASRLVMPVVTTFLARAPSRRRWPSKTG
jgi:hypothetical protein